MLLRDSLKRVLVGAALCTGLAGTSSAQQMDMAAMQKWAMATIIHYEVTGVLTEKHVQIPGADADQYADVVEKVTLSFDWDKSKNQFVGQPKINNVAATLTNLTGMGDNCPAGEMKGAYEHFDATELKANGNGAAELIGVRKHPETLVAESCGTGTKLYQAVTKPVSTWIGPPDPTMLALGSMMPAEGGIKISADKKSIIMSSQNQNWVWTFTPSVK